MLKLDIFNKEIQSSDQRFDTVNIFTSGDQVSFDSRPTVNGTGILLSGEGNLINYALIAPETSNSDGTVGQVYFDNNFLYICTSNNIWRRVQLSDWEA